MKEIDLCCIIDDDPIFVFGAQRLMRDANFCRGFLIFHDGQKALDYLSAIFLGQSTAAIPEVILLDLNMPVLDGWQFLDAITTFDIDKEITIFIVSSSIDPKDKERAQHYKYVKNFIIKPISKLKLQQLRVQQ